MFIMQNATDEQKMDKRFVIQAVARPGVVTNIRSIRNPGYDPASAISRDLRGHQRSSLERLYDQPSFQIEDVHYELEYVSNEFKDDKDVVLSAVRHDSASIKHASRRLQNDPDVIAAARPVNWYNVAGIGLFVAGVVAFPLIVILSPLFVIAMVACLIASAACYEIGDQPVPPEPIPGEPACSMNM